jgi:hypothetical protein
MKLHWFYFSSLLFSSGCLTGIGFVKYMEEGRTYYSYGVLVGILCQLLGALIYYMQIQQHKRTTIDTLLKYKENQERLRKLEDDESSRKSWEVWYRNDVQHTNGGS